MPVKRKRPPGAGRKSKLARVRPKILRGISDAIPIRSACRAAGIGTTTLHVWKKKGEAEIALVEAWDAEDPKTRKPKTRPALGEFGLFVEAVEAAEASAEAKLVRAVKKKTPLEILKRRFPKQWGDRKLVALEGTEDGPPIKNEGGPPVVVKLTFQDPDDSELWDASELDAEEGGEG